jgi:hypothetical protein
MQQFENILPTTLSFPPIPNVNAYVCSPHYAFVYVTRLCEQHVTTALHCVYMNNLLIRNPPPFLNEREWNV